MSAGLRQRCISRPSNVRGQTMRRLIVQAGLMVAVFALLSERSICSASILVGPIINPTNGNQYYMLRMTQWSPAGFAASELEANGLGGHLVAINDAAENDWVSSTFGPHVRGAYGWLGLGLNDLDAEGDYVWTNGEPVTYLNWDPDPFPFGPQPDGEYDDVVGMSVGIWTPGTWSDVNTEPGDDWEDIWLYPIVEVKAVPETSVFIFYNNSAWDDGNGAANAADDHAIAPKVALRPGVKATFDNYTSYDKGINGLMIDVNNLPGTPTVNDFLFRVGNNSKP